MAADIEGTFLKQDGEFHQYFYKDFTTGLVKRMHMERSTDDNYLAII